MIDRLTPKAQLDDVLPFRDPSPQGAHLPHPRYRSNFGETIADAVKVENVQIADYRRDELKELAAVERAKPVGERRLNMTEKEVDAAADKLECAVRAEIERTMARRKTTARDYFVRRIGPRGVQPPDQALVNQYGLFIRNGIAADKRPTFANGRIIGLFAGAPLKTERQRQLHVKALRNGADFNHYSVDIAKSYEAPAVTISPMGGGNSMAFANTVITAETVGTADPRYDHQRINAIFVSCEVTMIDKGGKQQKEQVAAVVGLDNLRDQVYLHYGESYLPLLAVPLETSRSSARIANRTRQRDDDDASSAKRRKLVPRSRTTLVR